MEQEEAKKLALEYATKVVRELPRGFVTSASFVELADLIFKWLTKNVPQEDGF